MRTNYEIRERISRLKGIACDHTISHAVVMSSRFFDPEQEIKQIMADKVAHSIAGDVMRGGTWSQRWEPQGEVFSVRGYWLAYDDLCRLMEEAYSMGRTAPVGRAVAPDGRAPRREWRSLTEEEIQSVIQLEREKRFQRRPPLPLSMTELSHAIEAALKEKNHE
jgi:hypothetical protein